MITITPIVAFVLFMLGVLGGALSAGIVACIAVLRSIEER